jgi:hypothetical protein
LLAKQQRRSKDGRQSPSKARSYKFCRSRGKRHSSGRSIEVGGLLRTDDGILGGIIARHYAIAAIQAMSVPTPAMIAAGREVLQALPGGEAMSEVWQAMLDAALDPPQNDVQAPPDAGAVAGSDHPTGQLK